ncbi:MAG: M6 family metalloprotease domain-containing protein [candidate division Zixibacteria bacterium]|nr:M6 family metalloprotease domain-containing protein [candidate division Zixibacteria bacterium]
MGKKFMLSVILVITTYSLIVAMPPHPDILEKIRRGEVAKPIFMTNPGYMAEMGINQGPDEPLFQPGTIAANWNVLAVLVEFPDQLGGSNETDFDSLIFGQTYSVGASLREFYSRASYGNLDIVTVNYPSTYGWHGLSNNREHYTSDGGSFSYGLGTYPNNSQGLCEELLDIIDPLVNFANYDNNGDNYVDGIIILHSGMGAETSGDTLDIWSHQWGITAQTRDGVYVQNYSINPEYRYNPGDATVGVHAHEFCHLLGAADLYDYDIPFDSWGLGRWSLMAYGGWLGNLGAPDTISGSSPAFLDAYTRVKIGFVTPITVGCFTPWVMIHAVEDSAMVYKLWTHGDYSGNEYFLVENRHGLFTDTALAAEGLLIYHVDENQTNNDNQWWPGQPAANHYMVALEQADNAYHLEHGTNGMDYQDPFRQNFNVNFGPNTYPNSRDYYGTDTDVSVTSITQGYTIFADLDVGTGSPPVTPTHEFPYDLHAYNNAMMDFQWIHTPCATQFHFQLSFESNMIPLLLEDSTLTTDYRYVGLDTWGQGNYFWRVRAKNEAGWSGWSWPWQFIFDYRRPYGCVASSPDTAYSSSFLVNWSAASDSMPTLGINSYAVYSKAGSGGWTVWLSNIDTLSYTFTGAQSGTKYYFEAIARDSAGNYETLNLGPECSTYVTYEVTGYEYLPGDANMYHGGWPPLAIGGDVTFMVSYFRAMPSSQPCLLDGFWCSADANGDCLILGSDVTKMVTYFRGMTSLDYCPDYESAWPTPEDLPGDAPSGWPNCE